MCFSGCFAHAFVHAHLPIAYGTVLGFPLPYFMLYSFPYFIGNFLVPISVVASFKKIKALINGHAQLATTLRNSSKLVS